MQLVCLRFLLALLSALVFGAHASPLPQRSVAIPRVNLYDSSVVTASIPERSIRTPHRAYAIQIVSRREQRHGRWP